MSSVRRAQKRDQPRVGDLWMAFLDEQAALDGRFKPADDARDRFDNDFPVWLEDDTQRTFVVEREGAIAGFVTAHRWGPAPIYEPASEVHVDEFYVVPDVRRQGLGRQLVEALRRWAEEIDAERIRLRILTANDAAQAFWKDCEATPFSGTMTMELESAEREESEPSRRRLGF